MTLFLIMQMKIENFDFLDLLMTEVAFDNENGPILSQKLKLFGSN